MVEFTERELQVIRCMYVKKMGIENTAKALDISKSRVRALRNQGIIKLNLVD